MTMNDWKQQDETFVVTRAAKKAMEMFMSSNHLLITGSSGTGKSSTAHHMALELHDKEGYDIIPFLTYGPGDIIQYANASRKQVFVIDDICGTDTLSTELVDTWFSYLDKIKPIFGDSDSNKQTSNLRIDANVKEKKVDRPVALKILITCRLHIYKDPIFQRLKYFVDHVCNIVSRELCLSDTERKQMLRKYVTPDTAEYLEEKLSNHVMTYDFFPLLCKLAPGKSKDELKQFFLYPDKVIIEYVEKLGDKDKMQYLCIAICALFNNVFKEEWLIDTPNEIEKALQSVCAACKIDIKIDISNQELITSFSNIEGSFIKKSGSQYSFIHDKIYEIAAISVGKTLFTCFLDHASSSFIRNRYILASVMSEQADDQQLIVVKEARERVYFDRLIEDLINGNGHTIFYNQQLKIQKFRELLINVCRSSWDKVKGAILDIAKRANETKAKDEGICTNTDDTYDTYASKVKAVLIKSNVPLISAALEGYSDIIDMILDTKCDINQSDGNGRTALYVASMLGHVSAVKLLIGKGADVSRCNCYDKSPLQLACSNGHIKVAQQLLKKGADVSHSDNVKWTPLHYACQNGNTDIIQLLLDHHVDISVCTVAGSSPLQIACSNGQLQAATFLLDRGADASHYDNVKCTPLHYACQNGNTDIIQLLLDHHVDISVCTYKGSSPLKIACINGQLQAAMLLLDRGADVSHSDNVKWTPLHYACKNGNTDIIQLLLDHHADISVCTDAGSSPLHIACRNGQLQAATLLLDRGADASQSDNDEWTPLHNACQNGNTDIIQLLLDHHADISVCTNDGSSPLHIACSNGQLQAAMLLLNRGADASQSDNDKWTPLHNACQNGNTDIIQLLLHHHVDISLCTYKGSSPVIIACVNGHLAATKLLIEHGADILHLAEGEMSLLHVACERGHAEVAEYLMQHGAKTTCRNTVGLTPLDLATNNKRTQVVELLRGLKPKSKD